MSDDNALFEAILPYGGDPADLPFWRACAEERFLLHRCGECGRHYWPASRCTEHGDAQMAWVETSGRGYLYTYTVQHHAYTEEMRHRVPYAIGVAKLEEGPFFHSRITGCPIDAIHVNMSLKLRFQQGESGLVLPLFVPA